MLLDLIAIDFFSSPGSGGSSEVGPVIATPERTAVLEIAPSAALTVEGAPRGSAIWLQPYDPGDHAPYAIDFTAFLGADERIAEIEALKLPSVAALIGFEIDQSTDYPPIIDEDEGKKIQLWFVIEPAYWEAVQFGEAGLQIPVTARIVTDSTPPKDFERSAVLTVRQL